MVYFRILSTYAIYCVPVSSKQIINIFVNTLIYMYCIKNRYDSHSVNTINKTLYMEHYKCIENDHSHLSIFYTNEIEPVEKQIKMIKNEIFHNLKETQINNYNKK